VSDTIVIPRRFNGPPDSGHGGWSCGAVARFVDGPAQVTLLSPPPLERELTVEQDRDTVRVRDGDTVVAEGRTAPALELEVPEPVSLEEAREANREGHRLFGPVHPFPTCFVCGPDRPPPEGIGMLVAPVGGGRVMAADCSTDESLAGEDGHVGLEAVWALLDCPSSMPVMNEGCDPPIVLARMAASIERPMAVGAPHVAIGWAVEVEGRKRHSGSALFTPEGELVAKARALWIELRR
jgi:hypothetical protein